MAASVIVWDIETVPDIKASPPPIKICRDLRRTEEISLASINGTLAVCYAANRTSPLPHEMVDAVKPDQADHDKVESDDVVQ
jgi:hypothetical protein